MLIRMDTYLDYFEVRGYIVGGSITVQHTPISTHAKLSACVCVCVCVRMRERERENLAELRKECWLYIRIMVFSTLCFSISGFFDMTLSLRLRLKNMS